MEKEHVGILNGEESYTALRLIGDAEEFDSIKSYMNDLIAEEKIPVAIISSFDIIWKIYDIYMEKIYDWDIMINDPYGSVCGLQVDTRLHLKAYIIYKPRPERRAPQLRNVEVLP